MLKIELQREIVNNFQIASRHEWLETNGLGGYAMGSVCGNNSRVYHGLFTIATKPPVGRKNLVGKIEETVCFNGKTFPLFSQEYPGSIYSNGHLYIENFILDWLPQWTYLFDDVRIRKYFFLKYLENTAVIIYEILNGNQELNIDIRVMISCRDHHSVVKENKEFESKVERINNGFCIKPDFAPQFFVYSPGCKVSGNAFWYKNLHYAIEEEKGLPYREDLYSPGVLTIKLNPGKMNGVIISTKYEEDINFQNLLNEIILSRKSVVANSKLESDFAQRLVLAADQFIVKRNNGYSIIAGYPWFEDWGRDIMISLPGLCLTTNRLEEAKSIILNFSNFINNGLLPNYFPDTGEPPSYNTVDTSLWYFFAIQKYYLKSQDDELIKLLLPKLREIIKFYIEGTHFGIKMDEDCLIMQGEKGWQLTWMDAKVDDWVVTPRYGKTVEIQALWYNALVFMADIEGKFGEHGEYYWKLSQNVKKSFNEKFWNPESNYLFDTIDKEKKDPSIRPNAVFAVSLPNSVVDESRFKSVVETISKTLYTSYGLRSLDPKNKDFQPYYRGDRRSRDAAYHQGTVWTYLLGPYIKSYLKAYGRNEKTLNEVKNILYPLKNHLCEVGLGSISEIFDGTPPFASKGCPAQAWSVSEILRTIVEENINI